MAPATERLRAWRARRTLRARLIAGLLALLVVMCSVIGVVTTVALHSFLVDRLDQQLSEAGAGFALSLEHPGGIPATDDDDEQFASADLRGQAVGTLGARVVGGQVTDAAVIAHTDGQVSLHTPKLPARDSARLAALPPDGTSRTVELTGLGHYRVRAVTGQDGDVLVTGLPMDSVEATVHRLQAVDLVVFAVGLLATGIAGAFWVGLSLRPLRRVAATAMRVADTPLATGEVSMPSGVEEADPRTEVGQVGYAFNHMLAHVEGALTARQASEDRLRQFVADASHELRTPLAAIRSYAELARRQAEGSDELTFALGRVDSESRRMAALVDDLLLLARLDAGRPLARETVDVTRLAIDATSDARAAGPDHRWVLELPDEPVTVEGDDHRLHQVLANLLTNARSHTPPGTTVTVAVAEEPSAVALTVADDGPGIPPALQQRVFERFVRADTSRSRVAGSTGLGLAIVTAVVAAHGGTVSVESRPGRTVFTVRLPRPAAAAPPEQPAPAAAEPDAPVHH